MRQSWCQPVEQFVAADRTPDHRRPSTSPRRHPVKIISHVAAMAGFQTFAVFNARPSCRYSSLVSRRCRRPFGEFDDPMHRIVEPNALAHGIAEDRPEQCHGAPGDTTTTAYDRETTWLGFLPGGRLAGSDVVHEAFNIVSPDRLDRHSPKQGNDVSRDPRSEISGTTPALMLAITSVGL